MRVELLEHVRIQLDLYINEIDIYFYPNVVQWHG